MWTTGVSLIVYILLINVWITYQQQLYLDIGSPCGAGICKLIRDCPEAIEEVKNKGSPQICSFWGKEPIVCCCCQKATDRNSTKRISELKCEDYSKIEIDSFSSIAVVGGVAAKPYEFPHMAAVGYGSDKNKNWFCGGTLISERYVLTAAHCLNSRELGNAKFVRVGDLNLARTDDTAKPQDFNIEQMIPHPDFKPPSRYNDIALLKLNRNVIFNNIRPACLYVDKNVTDEYAVATGWGALGFDDVTSDDLMKVSLKIFSHKDCAKSFSSANNRTLSRGIVDGTQLCAGSIMGDKDTCQGDSGGPLQISHDKLFGLFYVIGITSFGKPCGIAASPGVYTRVSAYVPWIESIVWRT